ncbi:uncharacterized protein LOC101857417 [Aplysia californica]|uniref:Uncharacterized protein LOC101857417 n=1 Tax=Aplysia californica TaxID=6500 RepID=A0ABM0JT93_APLCA|nr:uncharacterized protein LOC101857417 [Aplysia californica]
MERDRKSNKRRSSSILKRQDTCVISEGSDGSGEGPRTPRRVSFASTTSVRTFCPTPWQWNISDVSSNSTGSNPDVSAISEASHLEQDVFESPAADAAPKQLPPTTGSQPHFVPVMDIAEASLHTVKSNHDGNEVTVSTQNRTIMFKSHDDSGCTMELTSNISQLPPGVNLTEDASVPGLDAGPFCKPGFSRKSSFSGESSPEPPTEHVFMEITRNITSEVALSAHSADIPPESTKIFHQQDDNEMELTQNINKTVPPLGQRDVPVEITRIFGETDSNSMEITKNITRSTHIFGEMHSDTMEITKNITSSTHIFGEMHSDTMEITKNITSSTHIFGETHSDTMEITKNITTVNDDLLPAQLPTNQQQSLIVKSKYSTLDDLFAAVKKKSTTPSCSFVEMSDADRSVPGALLSESLEDMEMTGDISTEPSRRALADIPAHNVLTPVMEMSGAMNESQASLSEWKTGQSVRSVSGELQAGAHLNRTIEKENSILEAYRRQADAALSEGNKTIMFEGLDNSSCDMDMTTNISVLCHSRSARKLEDINESQLSFTCPASDKKLSAPSSTELGCETTKIFGQSNDNMELTKNITDNKHVVQIPGTKGLQQCQGDTQSLATQVFGQSEDDGMEITQNLTSHQMLKETERGSLVTAQSTTECLSSEDKVNGQSVQVCDQQRGKDVKVVTDMTSGITSQSPGCRHQETGEQGGETEKQTVIHVVDQDVSLKYKFGSPDAASFPAQSLNESAFLENVKGLTRSQDDMDLTGDIVRGSSRSALMDISVNVLQNSGKEANSILNLSKSDKITSNIKDDGLFPNKICNAERTPFSMSSKHVREEKPAKRLSVSFREESIIVPPKVDVLTLENEDMLAAAEKMHLPVQNSLGDVPVSRQKGATETSEFSSSKSANAIQGKRKILHTSEILKLDPSRLSPKKRKSIEILPLSLSNGMDVLRKSRYRRSEAFPTKNVVSFLGNRRKSSSDALTMSSSSTSSTSEKNPAEASVEDGNGEQKRSFCLEEESVSIKDVRTNASQAPRLSSAESISSVLTPDLPSSAEFGVVTADNGVSSTVSQEPNCLRKVVSPGRNESVFNLSGVKTLDASLSLSRFEQTEPDAVQSLTDTEMRYLSLQNSSRGRMDSSVSDLNQHKQQLPPHADDEDRRTPPLSASQLVLDNSDEVGSPFSDLGDDLSEALGDQEMPDMIHEDSFSGVEEVLLSLSEYASNKEPVLSANESQLKAELSFGTMCSVLGIRFDPVPVKNVSESSSVSTTTEKGRLEAKVFTRPKLECLKNYIAQLEKDTVRAKREVETKMAHLNQAPPEWYMRAIRKQFVGEDISDLKSKAQAAAQTCRNLARATWKHRKTDFLMKYHVAREEAHSSLEADVNSVMSQAEKLQSLNSQIDQYLHDIKTSKVHKEDMALKQDEHQKVQRETEETRGQCEALNSQLSHVKQGNVEVGKRLQECDSARDLLEEQLTWMSSLSEWSILHKSAREIQFGFLFNTVVLCIQTTSPGDKDRKILGVTRKSRLAANSRPWAKLSHDLVYTSLDCSELQRKYKDYNTLGQLLSEVSESVSKARHLSQELKLVHLKQELAIDRKSLTVVVRDRGTRSKVLLQTTLDAWPMDCPRWTLTVQSGDVRLNHLEEMVRGVSGGRGHVSRVISTVEELLSKVDLR